jgi:hypothetical protein
MLVRVLSAGDDAPSRPRMTMGLDPQKLVNGLLGFFSVLLPGAVASYLLMDRLWPVLLDSPFPPATEAESWAVFWVASYLLGHLLFLAGSWLDHAYDWLGKHMVDVEVERVVRSGRTSSSFWRAITWLVFKDETSLARRRTTAVKERHLAALGAMDAVNTFQWSKLYLAQESPASMAVVERFEADSKFFRCLSILLLVALPFVFTRSPWSVAGVILLLLLSLWRYMEQRAKSVRQAYWAVLACVGRASAATATRGASPARMSVPALSGRALVVRRRRGARECLVVEDADNAERWVLPEVTVQSGENVGSAWVRAVHALCGVWADPGRDARTAAAVTQAGGHQEAVLVMRSVGRGRRRAWLRRSRWVTVEDESITDDVRKLIERCA